MLRETCHILTTHTDTRGRFTRGGSGAHNPTVVIVYPTDTGVNSHVVPVKPAQCPVSVIHQENWEKREEL